MRRRDVAPLERLGRWTETGWVPVERGSVGPGNVRVFSHGWAPGLRSAVDAAPGFLRVWDEEATTAKGARFDRWYSPLAAAIVASDPDAIVLGYSWIDMSATKDSRFRGVRSQTQTTAAGHLLATALRHALADERTPLHMIGHSHGAKVVSLASVLLDQPPVQVTLFDSPENLLPIVGGALNDLSPYLRGLRIGTEPGMTFVDTYPSKYGIRYGTQRGLGDVVDCALDPDAFPIDDSVNAHSYAWLWYLATAEDPDKGVGYGWSRMLPDPAQPPVTQLMQQRSDESDGDHDPWLLEPAPLVRTGGRGLPSRVRKTKGAVDKPVVMPGPGSSRGLMWRAGGTHSISMPFRWLSGPPDATAILEINGVERWRSVRGWSDVEERRAVIPLAGMRSGPGYFEMRIESPAPAEIEFGTAMMRTVRVPGLAEYRSWLRPLAGALVGIAAVLLVAQQLRAWRTRHSK